MPVLTRLPTELDVADTTTETNLVNYTIPAGTLGTDGLLIVKIIGYVENFTGGAGTFRFRVKLDGTAYINDLSPSLGAFEYGALDFGVLISQRGVDDSQHIQASLRIGPLNNATAGFGDFAGAMIADGAAYESATEDLGVDAAVVVSVQNSVADASFHLLRRFALVGHI